jgi:hypothetical protein
MASEPSNMPIPLPTPANARHRNTVQSVREDHERRMQAIEFDFNGRIEGAQQMLDGVQFDWNVIYGEVNRFPTYSSHWFSWPFMTALALCEAPVNRLSFELFFGESPLLSLAVSLLVGAILVALAHSFGIVARRFRYNAKFSGGALTACAQLAFIALMISALCYGVAILRQGYLSFVTQPDPSFASLIENEQFGQAALIALSSSLAIEGWIFLFINASIVTVGILAAYFCHDPHPAYEKLDRAKKATSRGLALLSKKKGEAEAAEQRRYAAQLRTVRTCG